MPNIKIPIYHYRSVFLHKLINAHKVSFHGNLSIEQRGYFLEPFENLSATHRPVASCNYLHVIRSERQFYRFAPWADVSFFHCLIGRLIYSLLPPATGFDAGKTGSSISRRNACAENYTYPLLFITQRNRGISHSGRLHKHGCWWRVALC